MSERKLIKPVGDAPVPKADGSALAAEGETLTVTTWWRRRAAEGAVTITDVSGKKTARKPASKEA